MSGIEDTRGRELVEQLVQLQMAANGSFQPGLSILSVREGQKPPETTTQVNPIQDLLDALGKKFNASSSVES